MSASRIRRILGRNAQAPREQDEPPSAPKALTVPDAAVVSPIEYDDGLMKVYGRNVAALLDERFKAAYEAGMTSGHHFVWPGVGKVVDMPWRVYMACWAATHALNIEGDFVECGVHTGMLSLAVCTYVDINATGKSFYLFDTFTGIPEEQMSAAEKPRRVTENEAFYRDDTFEIAKRNFAPFPKAQLIRGVLPDTLATAGLEKVSYLSLDLNIVAPEIAAIEFLWPRLSKGAVVLLDDYGWEEYREQKEAMDAFAARFAVPIATLPTGQGLLIKP